MTTQDVASAPAVDADDSAKRISDLEAQLSKATAALADVATRERAREHFKSKGAGDPDTLATLAVPHVRDVPAEELGTRLDALFASVLSAPAAAEAPKEPDVPAQPTPAMASVPNPNPGASGEQPPMQAVKVGSAEFTKLAREGGIGAIKKAIAENRLSLTSQAQAVLDGTNNPV